MVVIKFDGSRLLSSNLAGHDRVDKNKRVKYITRSYQQKDCEEKSR